MNKDKHHHNNIIDIHGHEDHQLESLYRQASKVEPPAELDAAILHAARTTPARKMLHPYPWLGGVAASLLVAVVLVQMYPQLLIKDPDISGKLFERLHQEPAAIVEQHTVTGTNMAEPAAPVKHSMTTTLEKDEAYGAGGVAPQPESTQNITTSIRQKSVGRTAPAMYSMPAAQDSEMETGMQEERSDLIPQEARQYEAERLLNEIRSLLMAENPLDNIETARQIYETFRHDFPDHRIDADTMLLIEKYLL